MSEVNKDLKLLINKEAGPEQEQNLSEIVHETFRKEDLITDKSAKPNVPVFKSSDEKIIRNKNDKAN